MGIEIAPARRRRTARVLLRRGRTKPLAMLVLLLADSTVRAIDLTPRPHLPIFGGGRFVTIFDDDATITNASAHIGWALAVPLAGEQLGGRKGLWIAGLS